MQPRVLLFALAGLAACAPQNADVTAGSFTAFLSLNTSSVFVEGKIDPDQFQETWTIDCRVLADEALRAPGALENCNENGSGITVDRSGGGDSVTHEYWINRDAFLVAHEELDPWRGEAVITSEGDLNITFHHRLPGSDFRFAFVVDPNFQPQNCRQAEDGSLGFEDIDGDWVANWSRAMTEPNYEGGDVAWPDGYGSTGTLFFLNSGSYQFNPTDTSQVWALPPTMEAGYARARFGPEEMFVVTSRYGMPSAYTIFDENEDGPPAANIFWTELDPEQFGGGGFEQQVRSDNSFRNMVSRVESVAIQTQEEVTAMYGNRTPEIYQPIVPSNAWRKPDGFAGGFDGWGELNYSWVRFDQSRAEMVVGGDLTGEFSLWFYGANSQSHLMVKGRFSIDGIKKDRWTTPNVYQDKLDEAGESLCSE